jgi:hypothetical protein
MSLEDELGPKLREIERLALEWYELFLRQFGFKWDGRGSVMLDPERPQSSGISVGPPLSVEEQIRPMQENWRIFNDDLQVLLQYFRSFYALAPHEVTAAYEKIGGSTGDVGDGANTTVHDRLGLAFDPWFIGVRDLIVAGDWSGPAAGTFHQVFVVPFTRMTQVQQACVRELATTVQGYRVAIDDAFKTLLEIADACIYRMQNPAGLSTTEVHVLSVASIATGLLAFFPPVALAAGAVSVFTAVWTYFDSLKASAEPNFTVEIGGRSPHDTVLSTYKAVTAVEDKLARLDEGLAGALNEDLTSGKAFDHDSVRLPRSGSPGLDGDIGKLTVDSVPGVPLSENKVVTSLVKLHRAGDTNLAIVADQYGAASSILDGCAVSGGMYRFLPRSVQKYNEARSLLGGILAETRDRVAAVGEALVQVANNYQVTDERRAEVLRQISLLPEPYVGDEAPRAGGV